MRIDGWSAIGTPNQRTPDDSAMLRLGCGVDAGFEWRASKAKANFAKHGVRFEEALTVFADPLARIFDNPDHSVDESREIIVGHSTRHRLLIVSFTQRGRAVRIISARRATKRERHDYEQGTVVH